MGGAQSVNKVVTKCDGYNVDSFQYDWTVSNFQDVLTNNVGYSVEDALEAKVGNDTETFKLILYPNGFNERVKGYTSLWLKKTSAKERLIRFTCSVYAAEGCQVVIRKSTKQILSVESFLGWKTFFPINIILGQESPVLKDGGLTLECIVYIFNDNVLTDPEIEDIDPEMNTLASDLSSQLASLLLNEDFYDFTIAVQGNNLRAHKAILSARSRVFKVMLKSPIGDPNRMEITDIAEPIVKEMLNFMYSGKVRPLDFQEASDLYYAADVYELNGLKNLCCKVIKKI